MKYVNAVIGGKRFTIKESNNCNDTVIYKNVGGSIREVGRGSNLYEACREYDNSRVCCDDIGEAFENYALKNNVSYDDDTYDEEFNRWLGRLDEFEYFNIIRDGNYDYFVPWCIIAITSDEE